MGGAETEKGHSVYEVWKTHTHVVAQTTVRAQKYAKSIGHAPSEIPFHSLMPFTVKLKQQILKLKHSESSREVQ